MDNIVNFITAAVLAGTPLLFGTIGEILTEKSGNMNLGVEGMMFMGAFAGLGSIRVMESLIGEISTVWLALPITVLGSFLCGALGALIFSFLTITLRANQNVTGLTLTIFGAGIANFLGETFGIRSAVGSLSASTLAKAAFNSTPLALSVTLAENPLLYYINKLFLSYNLLLYLGLILAGIMAWFLNRTRVGLNLRAVGEDPATADAAGIPVNRYKYLATVIGGGICGVGGAYVSMVTCNGTWIHNCVNGQGWIAVALVIFATWSPSRAILGSLVFGALTVMRLYIPLGIPMQIYDTFPYVATVLVLIATSVRGSREQAIPAHCGINYFREDR